MRPLLLSLVLVLVSNCGAATEKTQLPPTTSDAELTRWLAGAGYADWHCEAAPHAARGPSPHSTNRVCSNDALSTHGAGEFPVGAASVKELFTAAGTLHGHAVAVKQKAGGGEGWYWFEVVGSDVAVSATGDVGVAKSVCVGCHVAAGSSGNTGHDFVFTQVK